MICVIIPYWKISVDIFTQQTPSLPTFLSLWLTLCTCKTKCVYVFNPLHCSLKHFSKTYQNKRAVQGSRAPRDATGVPENQIKLISR